MSEWATRPFEAGDEDCIVWTWLKAYAHAREVRDSGFASAHLDGSEDEIRFFKTHHPIVLSLIESSNITVLCDPDRVHHEPGSPAIIWGWACTGGDDTVHWLSVKRSAVRAGLGEDIARALLGNRLERKQRTTFELVDLARLRLIPKCWWKDSDWLPDLRRLSTMRLTRDAAFVRAAEHILDLKREGWKTNDERRGRAA